MFAIAPYLIQVLDDKKQPQDLWNFYAKQNLWQVLTEYYTQQLNIYQSSVKNEKRLFIVSQVCRGTDTSVSGVYKTGEFGYESEIYSTGMKAITHNRKNDEADMMPFNFSFYMPKDTTSAQRKRGLMLLGRFHALGIRQLTIPNLQLYFRNRFPEFTLNIERVVPQVVLETLMNQGVLKTIRLVKNVLPTDLADVFSAEDKVKVSEVELVIRAKRRSSFSDIDWLLKAIESKTPPNQIVTIPNFQQDNIKLEIQIDGHSRIVDLGNTGKLSSNIEIPDVEEGRDGHPKLDSWLAEADKLAEGVVKSWGITKMSWSSKI